MLVKNENIVLRPIHGSFFLINISDNYNGDKCNLYEINETGAFLWNHIDETCSQETLAKELQKEIIDDIPHEVLLNDVSEYISDLIERGFIGEVGNHG